MERVNRKTNARILREWVIVILGEGVPEVIFPNVSGYWGVV
jgi:hypothetical protein